MRSLFSSPATEIGLVWVKKVIWCSSRRRGSRGSRRRRRRRHCRRVRRLIDDLDEIQKQQYLFQQKMTKEMSAMAFNRLKNWLIFVKGSHLCKPLLDLKKPFSKLVQMLGWLRSTEVAFLVLTLQPQVLFSVIPKIYFDVAEIYQRCWLEESG